MASLAVAPNGSNETVNKTTTTKGTSVVIEMKLRDDELNESIKGIDHVLTTYKGRENVLTKPLINVLELFTMNVKTMDILLFLLQTMAMLKICSTRIKKWFVQLTH